MTRHTPTVSIKLETEPAERVRRSHAESIDTLQKMPSASLEVVSNVLLKSGVQTAVSHPLGRVPKWVGVSVVRGAAAAGYINEIRDGSVDRTKFVSLKATSYGADITVDLVVL